MISRRRLLLTTLLAAGCADSGILRRDLAERAAAQAAITPAGVLELLRQGNERFVRGAPQRRDMLHDQLATAAGQYPKAIVLSCIDSRAPAEFVLDIGIGDLFNARVAGNVANADNVGSMEYACKVVGAKLVLVMGHSSCGAVKSACDDVRLGNITGLLEQIRPAVEAVQDVPGARSSKNVPFVEAVARRNVFLALGRIREQSPILREMEGAGQILIAGSMYDLATGRVEFYR